GATASAGAATFTIIAKRDTLPAVLEILRQVLREPTLPADQFDVLKRQRLAGLEQSRTEPDTLASRQLQRQLNPHSNDDTRYGPTIDESIERVKSVPRDQVAQLYHEYLGSQAGELTIIGDFDPPACRPILERALRGWTAVKAHARIASPLTG